MEREGVNEIIKLAGIITLSPCVNEVLIQSIVVLVNTLCCY